jgi:hypothetical protein
MFSGAVLFSLVGCEDQTFVKRFSADRESLTSSLTQAVAEAVLGETAVAEASSLPEPSALYNAAIALGGDAQYIAEGASSTQDWRRAAVSWERALNFLKAIPPQSNLHRAAQAKIYDYEGRLHNAINQLQGDRQAGARRRRA